MIRRPKACGQQRRRWGCKKMVTAYREQVNRNGEDLNYSDLMAFIDDSIERWEQIKKEFSQHKEMSAFLKKAYPVIMFDHYQLDVDFAKNLYMAVYDAHKEKVTLEERKKEEFRQKMVLHFENELEELSMEIRLPWVEMALIQELKAYPAIKDLNFRCPALIRVVIHCRKARTGVS